MRILCLLTQDLNSPSGGGRYFPLSKELTKLGHEVIILALHPNYDQLEQKSFIKCGVHIHYVAPMHVKKIGNTKIYYSPLKLIWYSIVATVGLTLSAIKYNSDIIYICKPHPMNSVAGIVAKILNHSRRLFLDVDDYESTSGNFSNGFQKLIIKFFEINIPKFVDKITTNTTYMRKKMISWGISPEKIDYLPNGIDLDKFSNPSDETISQFRYSLGLINKKVIGYIGSFSLVNHPIYLLLEAFHIIHQRLPDVVLLMVGSGEDYEKIIELARNLQIANNIIFVGRIPSESISIYYHLCNVTVDPVNDDDVCRARSPLKLFESIACGIPVITSDVGDRAMLLQNFESRLLATPGDKFSLANKIIDAIVDINTSNLIIKNNKSFIKNFSWETIAQNFHSRHLLYSYNN